MVRLGTVWFGYISFLYFITQKLGTSATVPVSTAFIVIDFVGLIC